VPVAPSPALSAGTAVWWSLGRRPPFAGVYRFVSRVPSGPPTKQTIGGRLLEGALWIGGLRPWPDFDPATPPHPSTVPILTKDGGKNRNLA
jgi:hypothetical protein